MWDGGEKVKSKQNVSEQGSQAGKRTPFSAARPAHSGTRRYSVCVFSFSSIPSTQSEDQHKYSEEK